MAEDGDSGEKGSEAEMLRSGCCDLGGGCEWEDVEGREVVASRCGGSMFTRCV